MPQPGRKRSPDSRKEPLLDDDDRLVGNVVERRDSGASIFSSSSMTMKSGPSIINPPFLKRGQSALYQGTNESSVLSYGLTAPTTQGGWFGSWWFGGRKRPLLGNFLHDENAVPDNVKQSAVEMSLSVGLSHEEDTKPRSGSEKQSLPTVNEEVGGDHIQSKIPAVDGLTGVWNRITTKFSGPQILIPIFAFMAVAMLYGSLKQFGYEFDIARLFEQIDWDEEISVGLIGNAYLFVNDVPRVMEVMSEYHLFQNSVIHPGGSLGSILRTGNGMYKVWQTDEADFGGDYYEDYGGYTIMYDYGLCSVKQLLKGYDGYIGYGNEYGVYVDDGLNPCIQDEYYASFVADQMSANAVSWQFVVMVDQTKRMALEWARNDTIKQLPKYARLLNASSAIPVLVAPHAFNSSRTNMTGLGDIPLFTRRIHVGVEEYRDSLAELLPKSQKPIIAPIDLAFLTVWEEDRELWKNLFVRDMMHASIQGTYFICCVLYMTIFGHRLPDSEGLQAENIPALFKFSRKIVGSNGGYSFSAEEALYLQKVARRVVFRNHVPSSFKKANG